MEAPYQKIIDAYNDACLPMGLPKARITRNRKKHLDARWKEDVFRESYLDLFAKVAESPFLCGLTSKFKANFGWLVQNEENYIKVLDGNYEPSAPESVIGPVREAYREVFGQDAALPRSWVPRLSELHRTGSTGRLKAITAKAVKGGWTKARQAKSSFGFPWVERWLDDETLKPRTMQERRDHHEALLQRDKDTASQRADEERKRIKRFKFALSDEQQKPFIDQAQKDWPLWTGERLMGMAAYYWERDSDS